MHRTRGARDVHREPREGAGRIVHKAPHAGASVLKPETEAFLTPTRLLQSKWPDRSVSQPYIAHVGATVDVNKAHHMVAPPVRIRLVRAARAAVQGDRESEASQQSRVGIHQDETIPASMLLRHPAGAADPIQRCPEWARQVNVQVLIRHSIDVRLLQPDERFEVGSEVGRHQAQVIQVLAHEALWQGRAGQGHHAWQRANSHRGRLLCHGHDGRLTSAGL
mmetsp:Transcript_62158/g.201572  ORF Transcript_62158/g.201572 Transcript_62158/m.201572 type:complete len:221 (-) Transcript_62158:37-699(-)